MIEQYASPFVTLLIVIIGGATMWGKIKNMVEDNKKDVDKVQEDIKSKVNKKDCEKDMERGDTKFQEIKDDIKDIKQIQVKQGEVLVKIDTTLTLWARNNHLPISKDEG